MSQNDKVDFLNTVRVCDSLMVKFCFIAHFLIVSLKSNNNSYTVHVTVLTLRNDIYNFIHLNLA